MNEDAKTFWSAAKSGTISKVTTLYDLHPEYLDVPQESNETPLFTASEFGHKLVVEFLLDKGAKVDAQRTTTSTPLYVACAHGHFEVVEALLSHGANVNHAICPDKRVASPLFIAAQEGHYKVVQLLIAHGANVDYARPDSMTVCQMAARKGFISILENLFNAGASVDQDWSFAQDRVLAVIQKERKKRAWLKIRIFWIGFSKGELSLPKDIVNHIQLLLLKLYRIE